MAPERYPYPGQVMLIHEPPSGPQPWTPNLRVWRWVAVALPVGYGSTAADGVIGFLLILIAFAAVCRALSEALPYGTGLREHRQ